MSNKGSDSVRPDDRLQQLLEDAQKQAKVSEAYALYNRAASLVPAPVMMNTGVVRYTTGGNA
jgi:hypothetical protein